MSEEKQRVADIFCSMSDREIDPAMHPLLKKWDEPPTAVQVLEVLDECIHGALASGFVVKALQVIYEMACQRENKSHEDIVKLATWRDRHA